MEPPSCKHTKVIILVRACVRKSFDLGLHASLLSIRSYNSDRALCVHWPPTRTSAY